MIKGRKFWLSLVWVVVFFLGTWWVAARGGTSAGDAALAGAIGASVVVAVAARIGR